MQREQVKKLLGELVKYFDIIQFVGFTGKTQKEVVAYLQSLTVSESSAKRYVKDIRDNQSNLLACEGDMVVLNKENYFELLEVINTSVKSDKQVSKAVEVALAMGNVKFSTAEKKAVISNLKKDKLELNDVINVYKEEIAVLEKEKQAALAERDLAKKEMLEQPILIISSEKLLPLPSDWEKQFVQDVEAEVFKSETKEEEEPQSVEEAPPKESRQPKNKVEEYILNKANYLARGIKKVLTDSFMIKKIKELLEREGKEEFVAEKPFVEKLLADTHYTNQQKLALYAAFSEYRHTDFEKLLNFAGDSNINANLLIQWVESLGDDLDFVQIKNALRQFAKPTEYQMKHELARELLLGHWQVEFLYKGVPSRFRLVSEEDLEMVREMLGMSKDAFTYKDYVTYEMEEKAQLEAKKKEAAMVKKKELDRVQVKAPDFIKRYILRESDISDYELEEEAVDYKEMEQEDKK